MINTIDFAQCTHNLSQMIKYYSSLCLMQSSTSPRRYGFSKAAATLSLSLICLFTSSAVACVPGETKMSSFSRGPISNVNFLRKQRPIVVAKLQWGTVGVNSIVTKHFLPSSLTVIKSSLTTLSCCSVYGCSGSSLL